MTGSQYLQRNQNKFEIFLMKVTQNRLFLKKATFDGFKKGRVPFSLLSDKEIWDNLQSKGVYGSIIDVQKFTFIDFFGLHIIDYLC